MMRGWYNGIKARTLARGGHNMFPPQPRSSLTLLLALALAPSLAHSHPSLKRGLDTPLEVAITLFLRKGWISMYTSNFI